MPLTCTVIWEAENASFLPECKNADRTVEEDIAEEGSQDEHQAAQQQAATRAQQGHQHTASYTNTQFYY